MSDKQLAVLLHHLMRQINQCVSLVERDLMARGATLDEADNSNAVWDLRGLAGALDKQIQSLGSSV